MYDFDKLVVILNCDTKLTEPNKLKVQNPVKHQQTKENIRKYDAMPYKCLTWVMTKIHTFYGTMHLARWGWK